SDGTVVDRSRSPSPRAPLRVLVAAAAPRLATQPPLQAAHGGSHRGWAGRRQRQPDRTAPWPPAPRTIGAREASPSTRRGLGVIIITPSYGRQPGSRPRGAP